MNEQKNITPETAQLTDKAFSRLLVTSVVAILFLIACLCSTTYAWFVQDVASTENQIKAAEECQLSVTLLDGTAVLLEVDCSESETLLLPDGTYTVTLSLPAQSASGYLVLKVGSKVYHTDFIERHAEVEPQTLSFTLVLQNGEDVAVTFTPRWGIYAGECDVSNGGTLTIAPAPTTPAEGE